MEDGERTANDISSRHKVAINFGNWEWINTLAMS
jgi:hypothetical protein